MKQAPWLASFLLFLLALSLRLIGVTAQAPQPDEYHWRNRTFKTMEAIRDGRLRDATAHVVHPGATPALVLAFGHVAARKYNAWFGYSVNEPYYLDKLSAARIANVFFSALIVPLAVFAFWSVFGPSVAILGALFIATDPHHLAQSRLAHVDSVLSVFVFLTLVAYGNAVNLRSVKWKMFAGLAWGLSIAAKSPAILLLPAFIVFKFVRSMVIPAAGDSGERALISWSDVWTLIVGHVVFACTFTRLWHHPNEDATRLTLLNPLAEEFYRIGIFLQGQPGLVGLLLFICFGVGLLFFWRGGASAARGLWHHLAHVVSILGVSLLGLACFPQIFENLARFYGKTFALIDRTHQSFGYRWEVPPLGYWGMLISRLPTLTLVGLVFGIAILVFSVREVRRERGSARQVTFLLLFLSTMVTWFVLLGSADKLAFRYVLPVVTPLNLFAAYGLVRVVSVSLGIAGKVSKSVHVWRVSILLIVLLYRLVLLAIIYPDFSLFVNDISGGTKSIFVGRGFASSSGFNEAVNFLHTESKRLGRELTIATFADLNAVRLTYNRLYPLTERKLRFRFNPDIHAVDYVFVLHALMPAFKAQHEINFDQLVQERYTYYFQGIPVTSVYQVLAPSYEQLYQRELTNTHRLTGAVVLQKSVLPGTDESNDREVLFADPEDHQAHFLFFGTNISIGPGRYQVRFQLGIPSGATIGSLKTTEKIITLELGDCKHSVVMSDITVGQLAPITFTCQIDKQGWYQIRGFWQGTAPLVVGEFGLQREAAVEKPKR